MTIRNDGDVHAESALVAASQRKPSQALRDLGWIDCRNVRMDFRWAGGDVNRMQVLAKELVALQPEVIFAIPTPAVAALQRETREIPIVFAALADPIGSGFIASLPRPGGNITGVMQYEASVTCNSPGTARFRRTACGSGLASVSFVGSNASQAAVLR